MPHPFWPLFDLEIRTPRLVMRYVDDRLATELASLAARGVHPAEEMPFNIPWTDAPSPELERGTLQYYWRCRASLSEQDWELPFAALVDGVVIGTMSLTGTAFAARRTVSTGSWVGAQHQGQGFGTEMRRAVLTLAFTGFGAEIAETQAFTDNPASLRVNEKIGYRPNGVTAAIRRESSVITRRFRLERALFERSRSADGIDLIGVERSAAMLGIDLDRG